MKLFIVLKSDEDIDVFLEWSLLEFYGEGIRFYILDVEEVLKQVRVEDYFIFLIVLVLRVDWLEKLQV